MVKISDAIGEADKGKAFQGVLVPGTIVHRPCSFTHPPKNKFLVLAGMDEDACLLFVINTNRPNHVIGKDALENCQILLRRSDYPFLHHDSWLDCSEVIDSVSVTTLARELARKIAEYRDHLNPGTRASIAEAVSNAHTIMEWHRGIIVAAIGSGT